MADLKNNNTRVAEFAPFPLWCEMNFPSLVPSARIEPRWLYTDSIVDSPCAICGKPHSFFGDPVPCLEGTEQSVCGECLFRDPGALFRIWDELRRIEVELLSLKSMVHAGFGNSFRVCSLHPRKTRAAQRIEKFCPRVKHSSESSNTRLRWYLHWMAASGSRASRSKAKADTTRRAVFAASRLKPQAHSWRLNC